MTRYSHTRSVWLAASIFVAPTLLGAMVASCADGSGATGEAGDAALEATPGELDAGDEGQDGPSVYLDGGEPLDATTLGDDAGDATLDATTPAGDAADATATGSDAAPHSDAGDATLEATTSPTDSGGSTDATPSEAGHADASPADASGAAETGSDSGGSSSDSASDAVSDSGPPACSPDCPDGNTCTLNSDCDSGVCTNGLCTPPLCAPGCPDGNACRFDTDCASSACINGTCATSIACGSTCPSDSTCIGEAVPLTNEGQTCRLTCAGSATITSISDVYATNCMPTDCASAVDSCVNASSCNVTLSNATCGVDPCPGVAKGWSFSITCN